MSAVVSQKINFWFPGLLYSLTLRINQDEQYHRAPAELGANFAVKYSGRKPLLVSIIGLSLFCFGGPNILQTWPVIQFGERDVRRQPA
jgi:hypothetical protein